MARFFICDAQLYTLKLFIDRFEERVKLYTLKLFIDRFEETVNSLFIKTPRDQREILFFIYDDNFHC